MTLSCTELQLSASHKVHVSEDSLTFDVLMEAIDEEVTSREKVSAGQSHPSMCRSEND